MDRLIKQCFVERREGGKKGWEAKKQKQCTAPSLKYTATSLSPLSSNRFRALVTRFLLLVVSHSLDHPGVMSGALLYRKKD